MTAAAPTHDQPEHRHSSVVAEQALVGKLMTDEVTVAEVLSICKPEDFCHAPLPRIIEVCQALRADCMTVTPLTVQAKLGSALAEIGGLDYLIKLSRAAPLLESAKTLAAIISDLAQRRRCDEELEAGRERLLNHSTPIVQCLAGVIETTNEAIDRNLRRHGHLSLPDAIDDVLAKTEASMNGESPPAIRTGLSKLDWLTGGFHAGDFVVIAGRPGMGKTMLLSNIARAAAQSGAPTLFVSIEMPRAQIIHRLLADLAYGETTLRQSEEPLPFTRFRSGRLSDTQFDQAYAASQKLRALTNLEIYDGDGVTIHEIAALAERFASRSKTLGVIAIDYLQIIRPSDRYAGSKVQEITEISNATKALAKRIGWPVVVGCQLNRGVEARDIKRPRLGDLRESGAIEQDADLVLGLYRPGYYLEEKRPEHGEADPSWPSWKAEFDAESNTLEIRILKNRNGATGITRTHIEVAASAIRNRPEDVPTVTYFPQGYAGQ